MSEKPLAWLGASLDALRAFPEEARRAAGYQLGRVQQGLQPTDWKPMPAVGPGVVEIRIRTRVAHRVFYVTKFDEVVYVLHAFQKRTRRTSQADLAIGQMRYADLIRRRGKKPETR